MTGNLCSRKFLLAAAIGLISMEKKNKNQKRRRKELVHMNNEGEAYFGCIVDSLPTKASKSRASS